MLPAVDVTNMEHLAWTFDALFYLLQVCIHTHTHIVDKIIDFLEPFIKSYTHTIVTGHVVKFVPANNSNSA